MGKRRSLKRQMIIVLGASLTISNTLLVLLLLYNLYVALAGIEIPINGKMVPFYFTDGFEEKLLIAGIAVALVTTAIGIIITSLIIQRILKPLNSLSEHMETVSRENLVENIELESSTEEIRILISSFNSMMDKVRETFETQKSFSAYVAHELRTPLTVIQTKIDVYKKLPEEKRNSGSLICMMEEQIKKLTGLINRLMEFSNIENIELNELIPVSILIDEVFDDLEDKAREKNIEMKIENENEDFPDGEGFTRGQVLGNHSLLYQAFYNIVENAIKYNVNGGKVLACISTDRHIIRVKIKDTGRGIPMYERENIFMPFYRCKNENNIEVKGSGIGLPLSRKIVEHHKGEVYLSEGGDYSNCMEVVLEEYVNDHM